MPLTFLIAAEFGVPKFGRPLVIAIRSQSGILRICPSSEMPQTFQITTEFGIFWHSGFRFSSQAQGEVRIRIDVFRNAFFGPNWSFGMPH